MVGPDEVLKFWLEVIGPKGWYIQDEDLDSTIRDKFEDAWLAARQGKYSLWLTYPSGTLAYLILMDQFPRNMFRGSSRAFETDPVALSVAKAAINKNWDLKVGEPERQFFYMPLMHSENLCDQERCVRLLCERMPETGAGHLLHARAHREVIRQFGRFPYRNEALARHSTEPEMAYVQAGGYGTTVRSLQSVQ